jgi:hypothetical protein
MTPANREILGLRFVRKVTPGGQSRVAGKAPGSSRGESSEGCENPRSVSGVKQTRKVFGGENRQEVEKTWRRNVPGEVNPGKWTLNADDAVGTGNPMEGVA